MLRPQYCGCILYCFLSPVQVTAACSSSSSVCWSHTWSYLPLRPCGIKVLQMPVGWHGHDSQRAWEPELQRVVCFLVTIAVWAIECFLWVIKPLWVNFLLTFYYFTPFIQPFRDITFGVNQRQHSRKRTYLPPVEHGDGSVMLWGCFAAAGPGQLTIIESTLNSTVYQGACGTCVTSVKK